MKLSFHGADQDVTGSCHLVETGGSRILIDCGLFQGSRALNEENAVPFGFDAAAIDHLLLTHAHLDHCGRIPLLAKRGFTGEIITTSATRELAQLVMLDSAHLQEEDAQRRTTRHARHVDNKHPPGPLYTTLDATRSLSLFGRAAEYNKPLDICPGVRATWLDAGHILGSASILLEVQEGGATKRIVFSGDLGHSGGPLLQPPVPPAAADFVVMETTYGDRLHEARSDSVEKLYAAILDTFTRGGNVLIPTFALERAQELLFYINRGVAANRLPRAIQVYLDSPMAISATEIFVRHPECLKPEAVALFHDGQDPFHVPGLHFTRDSADSMAINKIKNGAVIMAGSGMGTGGRIQHHAKHNLWRPECTIVFVGYAANGTPARQIMDGAKSVRLFGEDIAVRAHIESIGGFSAHADQKGLLDWRGAIRDVATTFLVHGEQPVMQTFAKLLPNAHTEMPAPHQEYEL
ncbi:MAG TPA: MBL fold metallo-hydrolase [Rhizomicrobium sp.]|jgi:metallo-beta-lactamase family protein|nr:MBL fold metallo-hydrolase [Rhizomicrobium sp.]